MILDILLLCFYYAMHLAICLGFGATVGTCATVIVYITFKAVASLFRPEIGSQVTAPEH